jgi:hypothetical protein
MESILLFITVIVLLAGYIIYLHVLLAKKNIYIDTTVSHLAEIEKNWSAEEMMKFLHEIRKVHKFNSFFNDKLFEEKPITFLLENLNDSRIFIHYTKEASDAGNILTEGFRFADSFYKTALPVTSDKLDLLMKHNGRKSFGDNLMVLVISVKIFDHYSTELEKRGLKGFAVENILTEEYPSRNDNGDNIFLLPNKFVKGFINHQTGEITVNPDFNPAFDSPAFTRNLELLGKNNPQ